MWKTSLALLLFVAAVTVLCALPQAAPLLIIDHATILDGNGGPPITNGAIVIQGERIQQIGPRGTIKPPKGTTLIDASGKFVIPGLIDAHVHFDQSADIFTRPDAVDLRKVRSYSDELAWTKSRLPVTLSRYLASGVTSVVDMGGPLWTFEIRDQSTRIVNSPRVAVAGPLIATSGDSAFSESDPALFVATTPEMARDLVRKNADRRPDLTKILFIPGRGDIDRQFAVVKAATEESHARGIRVAVHAVELETAKLALRAGADILVHSVEDHTVDREFIDLARGRNVLYIATLMVTEGYDEVFAQDVRLSDIEQQLGDPQVIETWSQLAKTPSGEIPGGVPSATLRTSQLTQFRNLQLLESTGIRIVAGSDAGNIGTLHGPAIHREMELMLSAGMRTADIIVAATKNAATVMGREADIGTLQNGKYADLVILNADPLRDIRNTRKIFKVIKNGVLIDIPTNALK